MNKPTIAVDFDGVIYDRPKTEKGNAVFTALPVPGAMQFLRHATSAFNVVIFSARFTTDDVVESCRQYILHQMTQHNLYRVAMFEDKPFNPEEIVSKISFRHTKPIARVYLDDRAWQFNGTFPKIPELLNFKTWRER